MHSLRSLREQRGLRLRELAEQIEIDPGTVSRVERGLGSIPQGTAGKWADALGIHVNRVFELAREAQAEHRREIAAEELARSPLQIEDLIVAGSPVFHTPEGDETCQ